MHTALVYVSSILFLVFAVLALPAVASQNTLLIVGDSLSAAYGVPSDTAWVQLLRNRLEKPRMAVPAGCLISLRRTSPTSWSLNWVVMMAFAAFPPT